MAKNLPNKEGWASSYAYSANFWAVTKGLPASTRLVVHDAICAYGIEGVKCKTDDPIANAVLEGIYMQMDNIKGYGQRRKRGGQAGNQNARKHWNADGEKEGVDDLFTKSENKTNKNEYKTNKNEYKTNKNEYPNECKTNTPSNSLNNSDLDKTNKTNKNEYSTNIREDKIRLDNTSLLTELVLSNNPDNNPECRRDETPAPAPCNGRAGVSPLTSENRNGGESTPIPSSANSQSLQSPPPPTPAPVCGGKYEPREGDDETTRNIRAQCKAEVEQIEAGFVAKERGEPLPRGMSRIRANDILHDDSKEAEIERERAILSQYEAKAKDMEEDEETRALFQEYANKTRTKIANYEKAKNETKD